MNNNQATMEKMEGMRLRGMARAFRNVIETGMKNQYTADELISHLVDAEYDDKYNRKLKRLIKAAKFRYPATIEELDYSLNRNLDKNELLRLSDCQWVERRQDIILTGPSGAGKSF